MNKNKFIFILTICIFTVILLSLSVNATTTFPQYIGIESLDNNYPFSKQISFEDLGLNEGYDVTWGDVAANFLCDDVSSETFYVFLVEDMVVFLVDIHEEIDGLDSTFLLITEEGEIVTSDMTVCYGIYGLMKAGCEYLDNEHELTDYNFNPETYCYYIICDTCGELNYREHELYEEVVINPTCTQQGLTYMVCDNFGCGNVVYEDIVAKLGHDYTETIISELSCTTNGVTQTSCNRCNDTKQKVIESEGHIFTAATCEAPATCTKCGATEGEALGHYYPNWWNTLCQRENCNAFIYGNNQSQQQENKDKNNIADDLKQWADETGKNVSDFFNGLINPDTSTDSDLSFSEKINNFLDKSNLFLDKILSVFLVIIMLFVIIKFLPVIIDIFRKIFKTPNRK